MFQHVERISCIERPRDRARQHVMNECIERPIGIHTVLDVSDEERIEIGSRDLADGLLDDAGAERIGAADLQHVLTPSEHLGNELVARERKKRALRILVPRLVYHQSKAGDTVFFTHVEQKRILRFLGRWKITHRSRSSGWRPCLWMLGGYLTSIADDGAEGSQTPVASTQDAR